MRVELSVTGLEEARATLTGFSDRRFRAAIATALTRTAVDIKDGVRAQLPRVFDRPTPYTLNSLFVKPATAERLQADTYFKDESTQGGIAATKYLLPQVQGGQRNLKRLEVALRAAGHLPSGWFAMPGAGANRDAYGNMARGQIIQILSQLRITLLAGSERNLSFNARSSIRAQKRAGGRFFAVKPGARIEPGVYQREFIGRNITPVLIFVRRASYRPRFDFDRIAGDIARQRLQPNIDRAIGEQAARLVSRNAR